MIELQAGMHEGQALQRKFDGFWEVVISLGDVLKQVILIPSSERAEASEHFVEDAS